MGKPKQSKNTVKEDPVKIKILLGKAIKYIGIGGKRFVCPTCDRSFSRGMVYEEKGTMFCSRGCITI